MNRLQHVLILLLILATAAAAFGQSGGAVATISPESLNAKLRAKGMKPLVVDVREVEEFDAGHIAEAMLAPLATVEKGVASVPKDREIVLVCRSGRRSAAAYRRLNELGFTRLLNMEGGMLAWEKLGYPVEKK